MALGVRDGRGIASELWGLFYIFLGSLAMAVPYGGAVGGKIPRRLLSTRLELALAILGVVSWATLGVSAATRPLPWFGTSARIVLAVEAVEVDVGTVGDTTVTAVPQPRSRIWFFMAGP